jgi:hypothetical protein
MVNRTGRVWAEADPAGGPRADPELHCGTFTERQRAYLREHRRRIFLGTEAEE